MPISTYLSYGEIRTTCGLADDEIDDATLALPIYYNALLLAMANVTLPTAAPGPGPLKARFDAIALILEVNRTVAEQKLYDLARMFFVYAVAREVMVSAPARIPKTKSDGKATVTRFSSESVYLQTMENINKGYSYFKSAMENINITTPFVLDFIRAASPAVDVVTDE